MVRIKQLRESKGINMKEAARLLAMPYTTYVNYEKGQRKPTSEVLIQLADFFETTVDYLVGRTDAYTQVKRPVDARPSLALAPAPELSPDESELVRKYRRLDDAGKGRIRNALDYEYNSIPGSEANAAPKKA